MLLQQIQQKLEAAMPNAIVNVIDTSAGHENHNSNAHVGVHVTWQGFEGKSLVEQHQMIYKILEEELKEQVHALQITTKVN